MNIIRAILLLLFFFIIPLFTCLAKNNITMVEIHYLIHIKEFNKAYSLIESIDNNIQSKNEKADYFNTLGFINYNLRHYKLALKNYFLALKFNPMLSHVYNNIGIIYYKKNQFKKAKKYFLKAYHLNNEYPKVLINLALTDFYMRNYNDSFQWFNKAIYCNMDYTKKRFDEKKALSKLNQLINKYPQDKELQKIYSKWCQVRAFDISK